MRLHRCQDGPFVYTPGDGVRIDGVRLRGGLIGHMMIGAVMTARGNVVTYDRLAALSGSTASNKRNVLRVALARLRRQVEARGLTLPVETVIGKGLRWGGLGIVQKDAA